MSIFPLSFVTGTASNVRELLFTETSPVLVPPPGVVGSNTFSNLYTLAFVP